MENGHSWSSIKRYTLSEIGVFFKAVVVKDKVSNLTNISNIWMGSNLSEKGIKQLLDENLIAKTTPQKIDNEWSRLKTFMSGNM